MANLGYEIPEITRPCPKYKEVAKALIDGIKDGTYKPLGRLPSESELAGKFGASRVTVRQGIKLLEENGLVDRFQGRGTFVVELNGDNEPLNGPNHIILLIIDPTKPHERYIQWAMNESARLSGVGIALTVSFVSSQDLIQGKFPAVLTQDNIGFVLIDGQMNESHIGLTKKLKVPYFVIGNHPIPREIPQVRIDCNSIAINATRFLLNDLKSKNVALFVEPLHLFYTRELVGGYSKVMKESGLPTNIQLCDNDDGSDHIKNMLLSYGEKKPFSIVTTDQIAKSVLEVYEQEGLSTEENPILVLGAMENVSVYVRQRAYVMNIPSGVLLAAAIDLALKKYKSDWVDAYVELFPDKLEISRPEFAKI